MALTHIIIRRIHILYVHIVELRTHLRSMLKHVTYLIIIISILLDNKKKKSIVKRGTKGGMYSHCNKQYNKISGIYD